MTAQIESARTATADGDLVIETDVCIVGSGAGGAMVAMQVAAAKKRVVVLEEGGHLTARDFNQREDDMLPRLFQDGGGRTTLDGAVTVLGGSGVGGSTVHNTNLCKRAPAEVLARWGLPAWTADALAPHYDAVEKLLSVATIAAARMNRNNALLQAGAEKLGWRGGLLAHNRQGCVGSGFCELGCSFDAKQNALKVLIPAAVADGARVLSDCRAVQLLIERHRDGDRVVGVQARAVDGGDLRRTVTVRARAVCLSGSAVGSAALALASNLRDPERRIGRTLRLHPGCAVAGIFPDNVEAWWGIPQSFEVTEQLQFADETAKERAWIVPAFAHPVGLATSLPGFGQEHMGWMRLYPRLAVFSTMVHDQTRGRVGVKNGRPTVEYALDAADQRALLWGLRSCAELLLAAGAERVLVPFATPLQIDAGARSSLAQIEAHPYRPLDPLLTAVHPMGTLPLGALVDETGRYRHARNLWVADGSLFPTSLGGPPQLTIYAAAHKIGGQLAQSLS